MGCTSSGRTNNDQVADSDASLVVTYVDVERRICDAEAASLAPALNQAASRRQAVATRLARLEGRPDSGEDAARDAVLQLRLHKDAGRAAEHEEFIANINRQALMKCEGNLLNAMEADIEEEIQQLSERIKDLQQLYKRQDEILAKVLGTSGAPPEEDVLEQRLDRLQGLRDTLAGAVLEWKDASSLVSRAVASLQTASDKWRQLDTQSEKDRLRLAVEVRDSVLEAMLVVSLAQALLPGVQFPYCTPRELSTVSQAIVYLLTDMQIPDRYAHTQKIYDNFLKRSAQLVQWIDKVVGGSLKQDFDDICNQIDETNRELRNLRITHIKTKFGFPINSPLLSPSNVVGFNKQLKQRLDHSAMFGKVPQASSTQLYGPETAPTLWKANPSTFLE